MLVIINKCLHFVIFVTNKHQNSEEHQRNINKTKNIQPKNHRFIATFYLNFAKIYFIYQTKLNIQFS